MTWELVHGDARHISDHLDEASVDLIVTSPPYWAQRSYRDGGVHYDGQIGSEPSARTFVDQLLECTADWMRVLKPSGSIFVNLGDKYGGSGGHNNNGLGKSTLHGGLSVRDDTARVDPVKETRIRLAGPSPKSTLTGSKRNRTGTPGDGDIVATRRNGPDRYLDDDEVRPKCLRGIPWRYANRAVDELDLILRREIIWHKPSHLPENVDDRCQTSHEYWFHFTKQPRYFAALDNIREPHAPWTLKAVENEKRGYSRRTNRDRGDLGNATSTLNLNALGRVPDSVWSIASEPLHVPPELELDHFAAFPSEWPRRLIAGWCPPDGTVLDPFAGTGTTVATAHHLGRHGIGFDLSRDYLRLAEWRITSDTALRDRVLARTGLPAAPPPNQLDLFAEDM